MAGFKAELVLNGLSRATANRYLAALRAILRKAWREWEAIPAVPHFALYKLRNARTRVLSPDEERRLFRAAERNPPLWRLLRFLLATGARLREALGLVWGDVALEGGIRRPHAIFRRTKNGDTRSVPLAPAIVEMLQGMRADPGSAADPHVFLCLSDGPRGRQLGPYRRPFDAFRRARREAGLEDFRLHDLRHTCASRLVQRGVSPYVVGKLLGHRDARMTAWYAQRGPCRGGGGREAA